MPTAAYEVDYFCIDKNGTVVYYKAEMKLPIKGIRTGKIRNRRVYVYIIHEDRPHGMPSGYYVCTCLEGYHYFGFDEDVLLKAVGNSSRNCHEA